MKYNLRTKDKSIAEQVSSMRCKYPHYTTNFTSHSRMKVTGVLQPTSRSVVYQFVLKYGLADSPKIKIVLPTLQKNDKGEEVPHLYPGENLCLYHPQYCDFSRTDFLYNTIIPWTSLWLFYYEVWYMTGEWLGGGEHPVKLKPEIK